MQSSSWFFVLVASKDWPKKFEHNLDTVWKNVLMNEQFTACSLNDKPIRAFIKKKILPKI